MFGGRYNCVNLVYHVPYFTALEAKMMQLSAVKIHVYSNVWFKALVDSPRRPECCAIQKLHHLHSLFNLVIICNVVGHHREH